MAPINSFDSLAKKQNAFVLKTERVPDVNPKRFNDGKYWNYYLRIFLDVEGDVTNEETYNLNDVSFVRYQLHPSYKQPIRIADNKENNFQILVWSYGFYQFKATIFLQSGLPINLNGLVNFAISERDTEIIKQHNALLNHGD